MMRIRLLFYTILLFHCLSCQSSERDDNWGSIDLKRDTLNRTSTFIVKLDDLSTDSLTIRFIDFSFDSLVRINDSMFHYIYSERVNRRKWKQQMLLKVKNGKFSIPFFGRYEQDYRQVEKFKAGLDGVFRIYSYRISFDSLENNILPYRLYSKSIERYDGDTSYDSSESIIYLRYDTLAGVYYSGKRKFEGVFEYFFTNEINPDSLIEVEFLGHVIPTIEIGYSKYFFFNNYWFNGISLPEGHSNDFSSVRKLDLSKFDKSNGWHDVRPIKSVEERINELEAIWSIKEVAF